MHLTRYKNSLDVDACFISAKKSLNSLLESHNIETTPNTYIFKA